LPALFLLVLPIEPLELPPTSTLSRDLVLVLVLVLVLLVLVLLL
jgi:hypothetical protein